MTDAPDRRPLPLDWRELRPRLQKVFPRLLDALGIRELPKNGLVTPLNPNRADRHAGSFVIWTAGDRTGAWQDYAIGRKGDVIDLIVYLARLRDRMDAYWWALEFLGIDRRGQGQIRSAEQRSLDRERIDADRRAAEAKASKDADDRSARLFGHWLTLPPIWGTVAEAYLREARRIPLDRLAHRPGALRFEPRRQHIDDKTGEITEWPCMVSVMTRGSQPAGLHCTWLAPDGSGKAPVAPAKKMIGSVRGAAIRLTPGPSGKSPGMAERAGRLDPLAIGEGIETCLTVAAARPDYRVWAAGSLSLMALLDWPACASAAVLLRDNDWAEQARSAFDVAAGRWRAMSEGRPVAVAASAVGSDFNDWAVA